jgi:hypothetical protein
MASDLADDLLMRFRRAKQHRAPWEPVWRECYAYTGSARAGGLGGEAHPRAGERLFDGTVIDAVDQLAASLLAELAPPWSQWFGLRPGHAVDPAIAGNATEALERMAETVRSHLDRAHLAVELHQLFLDLATVGTGTLLIHEAAPGEASALRIQAVPATDIFIEEDPSGTVRGHFRKSALGLAGIRARFPDVVLPEEIVEDGERRPDRRFAVVEAVVPHEDRWIYRAWLGEPEDTAAGCPVLAEGEFSHSPFLTCRWIKAAGEVYGRSPVMSALPDVKTANKVVELVLKNASIAVTGIWMAEDDGVLNPANIRLVPGSIIPKAVGSAGLTPLEMPGRFDVSQLVLDDLRRRIRHTLLVDRLSPIASGRMTATEVLERSVEAARLLGAVYGRLQSELLAPIVVRAWQILSRRGEVPDIPLDGRTVEIHHRSPLARTQSREDVQNTLYWLEAVDRLGPEARRVVDPVAAARWLGRTLGVPGELVIEGDADAL